VYALDAESGQIHPGRKKEKERARKKIDRERERGEEKDGQMVVLI
jgi:hypothetical protein